MSGRLATAVVVDDEPLAIEGLKRHCASSGAVSVIGEATGGAAGLRLIERLKRVRPGGTVENGARGLAFSYRRRRSRMTVPAGSGRPDLLIDRLTTQAKQLQQVSMTITRRGVITGGVAAIGAAINPTVGLAASGATPMKGKTRLTINGRAQELDLDPRTTLLDTLREQLHLTGTKKGCDQGQCGACTVLVDGQRMLSCLTLLAAVSGRSVQTIEGLSGDGTQLHPMQEAFIACDAFQCGYCTPGQIMSGIGCVREGHVQSDADIRESMSGNLCRCGAYPNIVKAINQAKLKMSAT